MERRLGVLIADDFATTRTGVREALETDGRFEVVAEVGDGAEVLAYLDAHTPDLLLLDLAMPKVGGLEVTAAAVARGPQNIVVHTMYADEEMAVRAFRAGANAYVLKQDPVPILMKAIDAVLAGKRRWMTPSLSKAAAAHAERITDAPADPFERLSDREWSVLRLTCAGLTSREAGIALGIGHRTVESHRSSLLFKLGLKSQRELVRYAFRRGILH